MSISTALGSAVSGLTSTAVQTEVVASNIANALTEGYGARTAAISSRVGGGVSVDGISRQVDQALLRDRRLADAGTAEAEVLARYYSDLSGLSGSAGTEQSLPNLYANFDAALLEAASSPDSTARLDAAVDAAATLAKQINSASDGNQRLRQDADAAIAATVDDLNASLQQVADLNALILRNNGAGRDNSALIDQRQTLIDGISQAVPVSVYQRDNGTVALYSPTGATLLDVTPATFGFQGRGVITADMTQSSGALSGLTINGQAVTTSGDSSGIAGGALAAYFEIRDEAAVEAQENLDAMARDLIDRFQSTTLDPTLLPGDAGLFTDNGIAFDPLNEVGLAGRISLNDVVNPNTGGESWRLRDGLGALTQGAVGDATLLYDLVDASTTPRIASTGNFGGIALSGAGAFLSNVAN
ncbi:MAG: flagellar hook-associated protein FlgK, partial [Pseudomonadota bacterium]